MSLADSLARGSISTGLTLALGTLRGLWTLEALDRPPFSPSDTRSINVRPATPYRNLAREWIAANPREWDALMRQSLDAETIAPL